MRFFTALLCTALLVGCTQADPEPQPAAEKGNLPFIAQNRGFQLLPGAKKEQNFLDIVVRSRGGGSVQSTVLMRDNDRIAAAFWIEVPDARSIMQEITERSFIAFSKEMTNLVDEVLEIDGHLPIDVLAFTDPKMGEERFLFAHIGEAVYEFHIAEGEEDLIQGLLLELSEEH
jgi:hypothetical protein